MNGILLVTALGKLLLVWKGRASPLPLADPNGIGRRLTNCSPMKNIPDGRYFKKTVSTGAVQIENDGLMDRYLYTDAHEAIIPDEMFMAVQQEKFSRSKEPQNNIAMKLSL